MSLYTRIRGGLNVDNLPVWPLITSFEQLLSGDINDADFIARFSLSTAEQVEFAQVKTQVLSDIDTDEATHQAVGYSATVAQRLARAQASSKYREILLQAEYGYITETEFNTAMGIS